MVNSQLASVERPSNRATDENTASHESSHHLLGLRATADDGTGDANQRAVEAADQLPVRALVAAAQQRQELRPVEVRVTHRRAC